MTPLLKKSQTSNDSAAKQRALALKEAKSRIVKIAKVRKSIVFLAAVLLPLSLMVLLVIDYVYRPDVFVIEEIRYEGEFSRVQIETIDELARSSIYGNFFTVNLDYLRSRLEGEPWVRRVAARRQWPNAVVIRVFEHTPKMRWEDEAWVTDLGHMIPATKEDKKTEVYQSLVSLSGDESRLKMIVDKAELWDLALQEYSLGLKKITKSTSGAWQFSVDRDDQVLTNVFLGSELMNERFERFLRMYAQNNRLLDASESIDVRYPNGLAIKPLKNAFPEPIDPS